jgi:virulence-associated protein VapD
LNNVTDVYVLSFALADVFTAPALKAAVKHVSQRIIKTQNTYEQVFDDLQSAIGRHGFQAF